MDGLIGEFSATSEELLASIQNVTLVINELSKASTEGAAGTGEIAEKIANITLMSSDVKHQVELSKESSIKLQQEISNFIVG